MLFLRIIAEPHFFKFLTGIYNALFTVFCKGTVIPNFSSVQIKPKMPVFHFNNPNQR